MNKMPLASCIMPTANREKFIPDSIRYFQRQNYANLELVILDDGIKSIEHLIPNDSRIRYKRTEDKIPTIGAKRNLACEIANGTIIIHWDDDDWYADNWVEHQVQALLQSNADISGIREVYFYSPGLLKCWKYVYPTNDRPWVAGATMVYKKDLWKQHPFQDIHIGEDNQFVWFPAGQLLRTIIFPAYVYYSCG